MSLSVYTPLSPEGQLNIPSASHTHCWVPSSSSIVLSILRNGNSSLSVNSGQEPRSHSRFLSLKLFRVLVQNSRSSSSASPKPEVLNSGSSLETHRKLKGKKLTDALPPHQTNYIGSRGEAQAWILENKTNSSKEVISIFLKSFYIFMDCL